MEISVRFGKHNLAGVLHTPAEKTKACVITCHGLASNKDSPKYIELAKRLCANGIAVFRFDFRGCGESPGVIGRTVIPDRIEDLENAMDFTGKRYSEMGLMGSSLGGSLSILKAAFDERVKALVTWATPCVLPERIFGPEGSRYDVIGALRRKHRPILIVHGTSDEVVPISHAQTLFENANEPKRILKIDGADHVFSNPAHRRAALEATIDWFKSYLTRIQNSFRSHGPP